MPLAYNTQTYTALSDASQNTTYITYYIFLILINTTKTKKGKLNQDKSNKKETCNTKLKKALPALRI
jgi:hypothetical protein